MKRSSIDAGLAAAALALCLTAPAAVVAGESEGFRLSTFEADITIPIGHACMGGGVADAREIVDPLWAKGFVLLGADKPIVVVALDWCQCNNDSYDRWRDVLALAAGTTRQRVMLATVHQHDAPICDLAAQKLLDQYHLKGYNCDPEFHEQAARRAAAALRRSLPSARRITHFGVGQGKVERVASNRRVVDPTGKVSWSRGSASGDLYGAPENEIDPWLKTISFWDGDQPVLAWSCYAVHPMSHYGRGLVSADFPGIARARRQADDPHVFQIYFTGCAGDTTAGKYNTGKPENRSVLAEQLYQGMRAAWRATRRFPLTRIEFRVADMQLPARDTPAFTIPAMQKTLADPKASRWQRISAALGLSWRQRVDAGRAVDTPCLDLDGKAQFLIMPAESFVGYQLKAQALRPESFVMVAGFGEGAPGYIPTDQCWRDGYSDNYCWVPPMTEELMVRAVAKALDRKSAESLNLKLDAPITTWDEALPLGNGLMGGLLWGASNTIRLSLDRGDLWDERPAEGMQWDQFNYANLKKWAAADDVKSIENYLDRAYRDVHPTKIPAGRLEIAIAPKLSVRRFELNLATAEGFAWLADGTRVSGFFSAAAPVSLLRIPAPALQTPHLLPPESLKKVHYRAPRHGTEGSAQWFVQETADGMAYCVCVQSRPVGSETVLAIAVTSTADGPDPLALARRRVAEALAKGYDAMLAPHVAWWSRFWAQSAVSIPEATEILRQYYLVQYFHGAASRRGAPPMPLQGVWTADAGGLPPWKGDYHNDLNTQMTYMAYQEAGHFEEGLSYLDFLWQRKPVFEKFARSFYDAPGLACPGVMSLAGQPLAGWVQYSLSPTMSAWSAHLFYLHWRYTLDDAFLRQRAYPWCSGVGQCMEALLAPDAHGVLKLPLSSSPEIFNNSRRAWLTPNSNYDLMCLKMLFLGLVEMADGCGQPDEARHWARLAAGLGALHADADGVLLLDERTPLAESHRHLSNLIGLYPFNLVTREGGPRDRRLIDASLAHWDQLGTRAWCGYSFSWMSCLRARTGDGESALRLLGIFVRAFVLRNGFHANGDQTRSGYSSFTYRPFTLEGNFLAAQAVQEMLLQSWSPTPGRRDSEVLRIFPAMPAAWREASFRDLRAEGGYRVSARRQNGAIAWLRVVAARGAVVRIRDNFGAQIPRWSRAGVKRVGDNYEVWLGKGQAIEATFDKSAAAARGTGPLRRTVVPEIHQGSFIAIVPQQNPTCNAR